jgi:hypothetical protein
MNKLSLVFFILNLLLGLTATVVYLRSLALGSPRIDYLVLGGILLLLAGILYHDSKKKP